MVDPHQLEGHADLVQQHVRREAGVAGVVVQARIIAAVRQACAEGGAQYRC
ncbi:MAG TPA: hypothetical protein PKB14_01870 [Rubrivivax sp.]|nr:hypothetical protein [Rubrivivax sp.]